MKVFAWKIVWVLLLFTSSCVLGEEQKPSTEALLARLPTLMMPILSRVPYALPLIGRFIEGEGCAERVKRVGKAAASVEATKKDQEKPEYTREELNSVICLLGDECVAGVLGSIKTAVENMSFIKIMIEKQLPQGITIDMLADVGVAYYSQACIDAEPLLLIDDEPPKPTKSTEKADDTKDEVDLTKQEEVVKKSDNEEKEGNKEDL